MSNNITIPDGYEIDELPENQSIAIDDNGSTCRFLTQQQGNTLSVVYQFTLNKMFYVMDDYGK